MLLSLIPSLRESPETLGVTPLGQVITESLASLRTLLVTQAFSKMKSLDTFDDKNSLTYDNENSILEITPTVSNLLKVNLSYLFYINHLNSMIIYS